ncbi:MAG: RsmB/NOP family class I SAM-dependent RNA methyltransferase [Gammaproteobacteria bacterium]|nr:RsmB/NOP family class I SAM-dependent RNA methyltransferase [Gammaproteobacteria bacterium]
MPQPIHLKQSAELLRAVLTGTAPADKQMETYFRANRAMGVRDRGEVAEVVYACLRHKRLLEHLTESSDPRLLIAAQFLRSGISARAIEDTGFISDARALATRVRTLDPTTLPLATRASLPDWLAEQLVKQYGADEASIVADSLNQPAPVDLRVNTIKAKREDVEAKLIEDGFNCSATPHSPVGLRLQQRASVFRSAAFKEGLFEVQDEGSQLVSLLLEPRRSEMVVDFCAGAGGKTLHLGAMMANSGSLYAFDVSAARLERLTPRLRRAGLSNVRSVVISNERDQRAQRLYGKIDRVLVDAPCSGIGTLRRNPDIKWRTIDLPALIDTQKRILGAAASLLKPGGRLVYATCSLLADENEAVIGEFLGQHPQFSIVPAGEILQRRHISLEASDDGAVRLLPHRHNTDGFYAVALVRAMS